MIRGLDKLRDPKWLRTEFWRLFKYGIVGFTSLGIFMGTYALLSRVLWTSGNKTLLDAIALVVSGCVNYSLHRVWTFKAGSHSTKMVVRYVISISGSTILQTILFHVGNTMLGLNDFIVQIALVPFIAAVQYVINRQYTFNRRFETTCEVAPTPSAPAEAAVPVEERAE
jgi:putative flippase GtrA